MVLNDDDFTTPGPYDERVFCLVFNPAKNTTVLYKVTRFSAEPSISEECNVDIECRSPSEYDSKIAEEFLEKFYGGKHTVKDFLEETLEKRNKQTEKFGIVGLDHWDPYETRDYTKYTKEE